MVFAMTLIRWILKCQSKQIEITLTFSSYLFVHSSFSSFDAAEQWMYTRIPERLWICGIIWLTNVSAITMIIPRSNRTARKRPETAINRPETAVVIRQSRNVYKNGVKRWSFRRKKRPETAVVIRTDGLRWNRVKIKAVNRRFRSFKAPFPAV
jgi:hypothetical protein